MCVCVLINKIIIYTICYEATYIVYNMDNYLYKLYNIAICSQAKHTHTHTRTHTRTLPHTYTHTL